MEFSLNHDFKGPLHARSPALLGPDVYVERTIATCLKAIVVPNNPESGGTTTSCGTGIT